MATKKTKVSKETFEQALAKGIKANGITAETFENILEAVSDNDYAVNGVANFLRYAVQGDADFNGEVRDLCKKHEVKLNDFAQSLIDNENDEREEMLNLIG